MKKNIILLFCFVLFFVIGISQNKSDQLKKNKKEIEEEISNTQKLLSETKKNKDASLQQISLLRSQIRNREQLITELNSDIYQLEKELELNIKLSRDLDKKLTYMKTDYERVVYLSYKNRKMVDKLTFLLAADDFAQMFRRIKYYAVFADNVKYQVSLIKTTKEEIIEKNQEIALIKDEKLALLEGKEIEIKKLELDRTAKTKMAEELKKKEKTLASDLKTKQNKRKELDVAIKKAIESEILAINNAKKETSKQTTKDNNKTNAKITDKSSNEILLTPEEQIVSTSFVNNKGKLPWPVAKGTKILEFGTAPHPDVPSVMIENKGIDILVEPETQVRAIFEGVVAGVIDMMGSKLLLIRHGDYISVYQNLATVAVAKGSKVTTKQIVGTVAKVTGSSTYELHFEVWKNNTCLNPNHWLARN